MGGNLNRTGPHSLDMALVLFGDRMPQVFSKLVHRPGLFGDGDDFALVDLYGRNAPPLEALVSSYLAYPQGDTFSIHGMRGGLTGNFQSLRWRHDDPNRAPRQKLMRGWPHNREYDREELAWVEGCWTCDLSNVFQVISKGFYNEVYQALVRGSTPLITPAQVGRQVVIIETVIGKIRC